MNISEGFGRAAQSLEAWGKFSGSREIERLHDQRAENLARFQVQKQHEENVDILNRQSTIQDKRDAAAADRLSTEEAGRDTRASASRQAEISHYEALIRGQESQNNARLSAAQKLENNKEIQRLREKLIDLTNNRYSEAARIGNAISIAERDAGINYITDPAAKAKAVAGNENLSRLYQQMHDLERNHQRAAKMLQLSLNSLGDPMFPGLTDPRAKGAPMPDGADQGADPLTGGGPGLSDPRFAGNPHDAAMNATPGAPNPYDDMPAVESPTNQVIRGAIPAIPPKTSFMGAMKAKPTLIPLNGSNASNPPLIPGQ